MRSRGTPAMTGDESKKPRRYAGVPVPRRLMLEATQVGRVNLSALIWSHCGLDAPKMLLT